MSIKDIDNSFVGQITCEKGTDGTIPRIIVDGKEYSWDEFGHELMTWEGWKFKIKLYDWTEDID